ncbi:hypothetical protein [Bradyrhizobium sp. CB3481]|uniref:hypothetical protein n=1 Tax=Bradyrhizobium sp. CB3481 TaxID=3039158 RepID=UPI0024B11309|nr:hypothetical protein [Bradyrhizobium sp. CB3481]WFU20792.1 hypothetical protein QA643_05150 [Bradyrhizobium sp. CB3481]
MTQAATLTNRPADPERSYSLRAWLVDFLAIGIGALAVYHYRPDGFLAGLIVFVGAYTFAHSLQGLNWQSIRAISQALLFLLTPVLHLSMLMMAPVGTSIQGLVATFLLPGIAQAYWLWELWPATGLPSHPLAVMCAAWLALLASWIAAKTMVGGRPAVQLNPN